MHFCLVCAIRQVGFGWIPYCLSINSTTFLLCCFDKFYRKNCDRIK